MSPSHERPTTSVLLIDGSANDRAFYAEGLKRCSSDYLILEAADGPLGLALCQSRRVDCVVREIDLPDRTGCRVLVHLVPRVSRPKVAVIVLTHFEHQGMFEMVKQNGAYACFVKRRIAVEDLDRAIQRAVAFVGSLPKENRYWPI